MTRTLARPELIAWARLARTPRIGPITFHGLIARFRTANAALEALPRISKLTPPSSDRVLAEIEAVEAMGARLIASCEPDYPPLLAQLDAPPPLIALRGAPAILKRPTIAIVGSREGSAAALLFAEQLAADLGKAGYTIVSGMARGVDAAAHKGSLSSGTAAVLAGGLDQPYPPQNLKLHDAICAQGVVVSEAPLGSVARARDFPRRNSVISGLSRAVVVIEAALRSGSLITARAAADHGRARLAARSARARRQHADQARRQLDRGRRRRDRGAGRMGAFTTPALGRAAFRRARERAGAAWPAPQNRRAAVADAGARQRPGAAAGSAARGGGGGLDRA
jgi:DNA processing protein